MKNYLVYFEEVEGEKEVIKERMKTKLMTKELQKKKAYNYLLCLLTQNLILTRMMRMMTFLTMTILSPGQLTYHLMLTGTSRSCHQDAQE